MKKILLIIFILPCIMLTALADDTSGEDSMPEGDLIYKDMPPNPTKNRMPTNSFVVCYHESGNIELILPKNAETAMVNIFQNGVLIHSSEISRNQNKIYLPSIYGEIFISIKITNYGSYSGYILL